MTSPYFKAVEECKKFGKLLSLIPIIPGEKRPGFYTGTDWQGMPNWQSFAVERPPTYEIEKWCSWPNAGVGLPTGKLNGIIAVDFDNHPEIIEEIKKVIPDSPVKKYGTKGFTAFYKYNGEVNRKWSVGGETVMEILSDGRQTVLPPSLHPSGRNYTWITNETIQSIIELPVFNHTPEYFDNLFGELKPKAQKILTVAHFDGSKFEEAEQALKVIPADEYDLWIKIGMAIYSEFPTQQGFELWDAWSQKSPKYEPHQMGIKWRSFEKASRVNIASLFWIAKEYGFTLKKNTTFEFKVIEEVQEQKSEQPKNKNKFALSDEIISSAPGLVGRIASWINQTAFYEHPALALGASLAAVGTLKAHRFASETDLRTNLYTIGIAPSGNGKSHALNMIKKLFAAAGLENLISGTPVSDSALLKIMKIGRGRRLIQLDEIGMLFSEITSQKASPHKAALMRLIMEFFSASNQVFLGKEYADHDNTMQRIDINQPCLSVYGTTTSERFYEAFTSSHAVDGFLARWLVFETQNNFPDFRMRGIAEMPDRLVQDLIRIDKCTTNIAPKGNMDEIQEVRPKVLLFTEASKKLFLESIKIFNNRRKANYEKGVGVDSLWARTTENAVKIALCVEDSLDELTEPSLIWALKLCEALTKCLENFVETRVTDNDYERELKRIHNFINAKGINGLTKSELTRKTQRLQKRMRTDILESLIESEQVEECLRKEKDSQKQTIVYRVKQTA